KPLTIGVPHRVAARAARPLAQQPAGSAGFINLVSLPEIIGEISGSGPKSKKVIAEVDRLVATFGPELHILCETDVADLSRAGGSLLGEAVARLRRGEVIKEAGYDGEYGVIRLMRPEELAPSASLFDLPATASALAGTKTPATPATGAPATGTPTTGTPTTGTPTTRTPPTGTPTTGRRPTPGAGRTPGRGRETADPSQAGRTAGESVPPGVSQLIRGATGSLLDRLDPDQRAAAEAAGPLMIIAGPGTGKTRTLTYRIAVQIAERGLPPEACLALTFTRRAAGEVRERLEKLAPAEAARLTVTTFHGLGQMILREHATQAGLTPDFGIADEQARLDLAAEIAGSRRGARQLLAAAAADPERRAEFSAALA